MNARFGVNPCSSVGVPSNPTTATLCSIFPTRLSSIGSIPWYCSRCADASPPVCTTITSASGWSPVFCSRCSVCSTPSSVRRKSSAFSVYTSCPAFVRTSAGTTTRLDRTVIDAPGGIASVCPASAACAAASAAGVAAAGVCPRQKDVAATRTTTAKILIIVLILPNAASSVAATMHVPKHARRSPKHQRQSPQNAPIGCKDGLKALR